MLNVHTRFGDETDEGWPFQKVAENERVGRDAYRAGQPESANPFTDPFDRAQWTVGYKAAAADRVWSSPLVEALIVSSARLAVGFVVSIIIGAFIGALAWRFTAVDDFIGPVLLGLQTLPSVCWVPLAIVASGFTETSILFVLTLGSFSAVAIALRDGLRAIPPLYQQAGRMMGARSWRLYWYVLLPASLPALATSLRQGFSFAWRSLMGAELILTAIPRQGLGMRLSVARDTAGDVSTVMALLIIMILIGMLTDKWVFARIQRAISARFGLVAR